MHKILRADFLVNVTVSVNAKKCVKKRKNRKTVTKNEDPDPTLWTDPN